MSEVPPGSGAGDDRGALNIEFIGSQWTLLPGEDLCFGRQADIVVDENPFMHRVVGRFVHREGLWWLQNHGSRTALEICDLVGHTSIEVAPRQQMPIVAQSFAVRFTAGPTDYELTGSHGGPTVDFDEVDDVVGTDTISFGGVPLSPEQHLLIVALYESSLRCGGNIEGNAVIARRLRWTSKKFNRKLDAVCEKLSKVGVRGLKGQPGEMAQSRREALVAHARQAGLVTVDDLGLVTGAGARTEHRGRAEDAAVQ